MRWPRIVLDERVKTPLLIDSGQIATLDPPRLFNVEIEGVMEMEDGSIRFAPAFRYEEVPLP